MWLSIDFLLLLLFKIVVFGLGSHFGDFKDGSEEFFVKEGKKDTFDFNLDFFLVFKLTWST
jgi:hypothetical protein